MIFKTSIYTCTEWPLIQATASMVAHKAMDHMLVSRVDRVMDKEMAVALMGGRATVIMVSRL